MRCPSCGATVQAGINRCDRCGSYVEPLVPQQAAPMHPVQPFPPQPLSPPMGPPKSRVVAGILGILLGGLGIHRFYMGCAGIGIAQLLLTLVGGMITCGVTAVAAWIWGLTEGILILTGAITTDGDGRPLE